MTRQEALQQAQQHINTLKSNGYDTSQFESQLAQKMSQPQDWNAPVNIPQMQGGQQPQQTQPTQQGQQSQMPGYGDSDVSQLIQRALAAGRQLQPNAMQSVGNFIGGLGGHAPYVSPGQEIAKSAVEKSLSMTPIDYALKASLIGQHNAQATNQNTQAGIFPDQGNQQTASGLPPAFDSMANDVANYKMDLKTALQRVPAAIKAKFTQGVSALNPTYDQKVYQARQDYQNSLASGPVSKNVTALNTIIPHIDRLNQSLQALGNGNFPLLNGVKNWFAQNTGSGAPGRASTDLVAVSNEIESVYRQTGGTEEGIRAWRAGQPALSASPDQQKQWMQEGLGLIQGRIGALENQYQQNMGEQAPKNRFMNQPNEQIINRLGGQGGGNNSGSGTTKSGNSFRKIG